MSKLFKEMTQEIRQLLTPFRKEAKEHMANFDSMAKAAMAPGVLSELEKGLIATGIAVSTRCDSCIGFHVKSLVRLGATREQVNEMLAVTVYMGGGPSLMYAAEVLCVRLKSLMQINRPFDFAPCSYAKSRSKFRYLSGLHI